MRRNHGKRPLSWVIVLLLALLLVLLFPFLRRGFMNLFPDLRGEITAQCSILKQKLESSSRLEVTTVEEEGVLEAKTRVVLLGTVGKTSIRYRYNASVGIDLSRVEVKEEEDAIVFHLPPWEILNDGITALEVKKQDFFSHAIDKSTEELLEEQRVKCRKQFEPGGGHDEKLWADTTKALEETVCEWLASYGQRHYRFEFRRKQPDDNPA